MDGGLNLDTAVMAVSPMAITLAGPTRGGAVHAGFFLRKAVNVYFEYTL
jgi:hypothetical protein